MSYSTVTITSGSVPVTGIATEVSVEEKGQNLFVPTFKKLLVIPTQNVYEIRITDWKIAAASSADVNPYTDDIAIVVDDTSYARCRRLGGELKPVQVAPNETLMQGTIIYRGYLWRSV